MNTIFPMRDYLFTRKRCYLRSARRSLQNIISTNNNNSSNSNSRSISIENECLRNIAIELNNVGVDLYAADDHTYAMELYKEAIRAIMTTVRPNQGDVAAASLDETRNSLIAQIVEGKQRLHDLRSSSSSAKQRRSKSDRGDGSSQIWSDSDARLTPRCLFEAIKMSDTLDGVNAATIMYNMGLIHMKEKEYCIAKKILELALALRPTSDDKNKSLPIGGLFSAILNNLSFIQYNNGSYNESKETLYDALEIGENALSHSRKEERNNSNNNNTLGDDNTTRLQKYVGTICYNLGLLNACLGFYENTTQPFNYSISIHKTVFGDNHPNIAILEHNIGTIYLEIGKIDLATACFMESLRIIRFVYGNDHHNVAKELFHLAHVYDTKGDYDEALYVYEETLRVEIMALGRHHPNTIITLCKIGKMCHETGDFEKGIAVYNEALRLAKGSHRYLEQQAAVVVFILCQLSKIHVEFGDVTEAKMIYVQAAEAIEQADRYNVAIDTYDFTQLSDLLANPPAAAAA